MASFAPVLTVILAFVISGFVVSRISWDERPRPLPPLFQLGGNDIGLPFSDARVWFPWNTDDVSSLSPCEPPADAVLWVPLVLTGLAVAFAFRCGLFNIGGQGQYEASPVRLLRYCRNRAPGAGPPACPLIAVTVLGAMLAGALYKPDRRRAEGDRRGTRGHHDDHAQLDRHLGGVVPLRHRRPVPDVGLGRGAIVRRRPRSGEAFVFWGDPLLQGCTSVSSPRSPPSLPTH